MLEHERIRQERCGCRYDVVTGLRTYQCPLDASEVCRVTFYRGRPTRGAKLKPVLTVICDPYGPRDPWKRDAEGRPLFGKLGLHDIKRRIVLSGCVR